MVLGVIYLIILICHVVLMTGDIPVLSYTESIVVHKLLGQENCYGMG
mgnify:CR=1 FL=1